MNTIRISTLTASALLLVLLAGSSRALAQSGHSVMNGYVAFEGLNYVDKQPRAKVELLGSTDGKHGGVTAETDEHGLYHIDPAPLGEYVLRISAPGFITYQISVYIPSDFVGNLAVMLKKAEGKQGEQRNH